jgi:hypothetical protein
MTAQISASKESIVMSYKFFEHCHVYVDTPSVVRNKEFFRVLGCWINIGPQWFPFIWSKGSNINKSFDIVVLLYSAFDITSPPYECPTRIVGQLMYSIEYLTVSTSPVRD